MKRLIQWSIDNHWIVIAMSVLLAACGLWVARDMPVDVFPDLTAPTVTILTEGRGMAPEEMESLVTFPIEAAINGASGVRRVRSATALGIAVVWVEFDWGTDIFGARQIVAEKLALVGGTLPPQVDRPVLAPISSIMGEILFFALSSDTDDPLALRTVADTVVRRRLLAIAGVSQVTPLGGAERQFQVIAHPDQLRANSVSVTELLDAVRGASQNTSAGIYTEGPQEYVLQAVGRVRSPAEIGESLVVLRGSRSVLIRDVADVREGGALKRGEGSQERQAGGDRRRAEAAGRQHHRADQAPRPRARHAPEGAAARDDHRSQDFPPVRLHRGRRRQRDHGAARWRPAGHRDRPVLSRQRPRGDHHADGDAAVAGRGGARPARLRRDDQHHDARGAWRSRSARSSTTPSSTSKTWCGACARTTRDRPASGGRRPRSSATPRWKSGPPSCSRRSSS